MSGERKRSVAAWPKLPRLSSTLPTSLSVRGRPGPLIRQHLSALTACSTSNCCCAMNILLPRTGILKAQLQGRLGLSDAERAYRTPSLYAADLLVGQCHWTYPPVLTRSRGYCSTRPRQPLAEGLWRYFPERTTTRHYQIYGRGDWPLGGVRLQEISALRIGCPRCPPHCVMGRSAAPPEKDTGHYARLFELPGSFP
jgi:hypothetical protein